jgi:hypothetical protein
MSHGRVILRKSREKMTKEWTNDPGKKIYGSCPLPYVHETEEKAHDTNQSNGNCYTGICGFKYTVHDRFEDLSVSHYKSDQGNYECNQEKCDPQKIQYHTCSCGMKVKQNIYLKSISRQFPFQQAMQGTGNNLCSKWKIALTLRS